MTALGRKLRRLEGDRVAFWCPGCCEAHQLRVPPHPHAWGFNGDGDAPTFTPSVLVGGLQTAKDENGAWNGDYVRDAAGDPLPRVCHSFVTDGRIKFLGDCTHALAGQTVDLPDFPGSAP